MALLRVLCQHASDMSHAWYALCSASGAQSSCAQHRRHLHSTRLPEHQFEPALSARRVLRVQAGRRARGTTRWRCAPWPRPAQTARASTEAAAVTRAAQDARAAAFAALGWRHWERAERARARVALPPDYPLF